jgi:hypothetical protein
MLSDPTLDLQAAVVALILDNPDAAAIVADRVYDKIPNSPTFPYVSLGEFQVLPELGEGTNAVKVSMTLHTWDRFKSSVGTKSVARAIVAALHDQPIAISNGKVQSCLLDSSRVLPDPDGLTSHGVLIFEVLIDSNATQED